MTQAKSTWTRCFDAALSWVYPPGCAVCSLDGPSSVCDDCLAEMRPANPPVRYTPDEPMAFVAAAYRYVGPVRDAVRRLKYSRSTVLTEFMAGAIAQVLRQVAIGDELAVPVPIHWRRRAWRGFNQSELLLEGDHGLEVASRSLLRIRATAPQVGLSLDQRLRNLDGAFEASTSVAGRRVLLVDDVLTSGQTARVCASALLVAGAAEVGVVTFAVGDRLFEPTSDFPD